MTLNSREEQANSDKSAGERVKVKADTRFGQRQILCHDRPINALPLKQAKTDAKEWQVLSLAEDSGAAESVIPHLLINEHPIRETEASSSGLNYISATGDPISQPWRATTATDHP